MVAGWSLGSEKVISTAEEVGYSFPDSSDSPGCLAGTCSPDCRGVQIVQGEGSAGVRHGSPEYFKTVVRIGSFEVDMLAPVPFLSLSRDLTKPEPGMTGGFVGRTGGIVRELDATPSHTCRGASSMSSLAPLSLEFK